MSEKNFNTGEWNIGRYNTGMRNTGNCNSGDCNTGKFNTGSYNAGDCNTSSYNAGDCNTGNYNVGNCNTGNYNAGDWNTGDWNAGDWNTGDWNKASFCVGCFNTEEQNITLFNKLSDWKYCDWLRSHARHILNKMPPAVEWVDRDEMDNSEEQHPESKVTGGYLKSIEANSRQMWWDRLADYERKIIEALPNFDPCIFFQCTGIKVEEE